MNRLEIVEILNEYAFDNNIKPVVEYLNTILEKSTYENELDLIFMAIATAQLYGFLSYLTEEEKDLFFDCDYFRSNSYRGVEIPFYNRGQLSFLYELDSNKKVFFSAPTSFGKTSIVTEYILNNTRTLNNIVFIVPTNSLLEELFEKFTLYNSKLSLNYNVTTQPIYPLTGRNLLFLTPERFMTMAESWALNSFDLIIMDETYKIVSNIIQYKIPFYLTFYVSVFKLFIKKNKQLDILQTEFDINKLINIFEDRDTKEEYSKLIDYGLPITTVDKISDSGISLDDLKAQEYDDKNFDDYEKIIIREVVDLL